MAEARAISNKLRPLIVVMAGTTPARRYFPGQSRTIKATADHAARPGITASNQCSNPATSGSGMIVKRSTAAPSVKPSAPAIPKSSTRIIRKPCGK